jgi:uncharacterized protein (PEP-CTERM system associated)
MPQLHGCAPQGMLLVVLGWSTMGHAQPVGRQSLMQPMGPAQTGISAESPELRQQVDGLFEAPANQTAPGQENAQPEEQTPGEEGEDEKKVKPVLQISPSIGVSGAWTNAAPGNGSKSNDSGIGLLEPALLVNANTDRVQGTLNLTPKLQYYTNASGQNGFDNDFDANAHLTLWPEHFFLNLQGYGVVQSTLGGVGPSGTTVLDRRTADQAYTFAATPYLRQGFGDLLTAEAGMKLGYTSQALLDDSLLTGPSNDTANQYMDSLREYAGFTLGPAFGRTSGDFIASATQMDGTGVSRNAHSNVILLDLGYGITRSFTALGTTGYEDIAYNVVPRYRLNDGVWRAGFHWAPETDSSITATYGRQYGIDALRLDAAYAPTAYIRLYARYSEEVTSELEGLQDAVASSILDPLGSPVDPVTGAPLLLTNNFFSSQLNDVLTRTSTGSVSAALLYDRDTIALTATYQRERPIGYTPDSSQGAIFVTEKDLLGSIGWAHDANPDLRLNAFFEYGTRSGGNLGGGGNSTLFVASISLSYVLSERTSLRVQYSYSDEPTATNTGGTNIVTIGIRWDL